MIKTTKNEEPPGNLKNDNRIELVKCANSECDNYFWKYKEEITKKRRLPNGVLGHRRKTCCKACSRRYVQICRSRRQRRINKEIRDSKGVSD